MLDSGVVIVILASLSAIVVGGLILFAVAGLRGRVETSPLQGVDLFAKGLAVVLIAVALLMLIAVGASTAYLLLEDDLDGEATALLAVCLVLTIVLGSTGLLLWTVVRSGGQGTARADVALMSRNLTILTVIGCTFVFVPPMLLALPLGVLFPLIMLLGVFAAGCGAVAFIALAAHRRRARESSLLWLLAIAVEQRIPLAEEVEAHAGSVQGMFRSRLRAFAALLRTGESLPDALLRTPGLLSAPAVTAIQVAVETDSLPRTLRQLAARGVDHLKLRTGTPSLAGLLVYQVALLTIAQFIVAGVMIYIIPKFMKIFEGFNTELPAVTIALIDTSDFLATYFFIFGPLLLLPIAVIVALAVGYVSGWENVRAPWLTRWFIRSDTPPILANLARIVASGKPLPAGLAPMAVLYHRLPVRRRLEQVENDVAAGKRCWPALHAAGLINRRELAVLDAAERVGNLPWALDELSESIQRRQRFRLLAWCETLWPFCVVAVGALVCWICVAFFMPLVQLLSGLS